MAWLEFRADMERTAAALERIADALERAYPPNLYLKRTIVEPTGELISTTDEELARWEEEERAEKSEAEPPAE
jgi:hypothetical protein